MPSCRHRGTLRPCQHRSATAIAHHPANAGISTLSQNGYGGSYVLVHAGSADPAWASALILSFPQKRNDLPRKSIVHIVNDVFGAFPVHIMRFQWCVWLHSRCTMGVQRPCTAAQQL